ncbi:MAG: 3'(2'),5'-bisphosphate nucleotidase CysQ [Pseudomonadota bacterium]
MSELDLAKLLPEVCALAHTAGLAIMKIYNTAFSVTQKQDDTPVTEADLTAHRIIREGLTRITPEMPQICEESPTADYARRAAWRYLWLIDPLDGTREFIKRNGEFTVNIALIADHAPVLGVIYVPDAHVTYFAARDLGAYKQTANAPAQPIHTRRAPAVRKIIAGSRSHAGQTLQTLLSKMGEYELIQMGSSLKSCLIAEGQADIYARFGRTSEWDTAAAQCIVEQAGGAVLDTHLKPLRYNTKGHLYNPNFIAVGDPQVEWGKYIN